MEKDMKELKETLTILNEKIEKLNEKIMNGNDVNTEVLRTRLEVVRQFKEDALKEIREYYQNKGYKSQSIESKIKELSEGNESTSLSSVRKIGIEELQKYKNNGITEIVEGKQVDEDEER